MTFSLTPIEGYLLSLSSINPYNIRRSGTGPTTGQWQYQIGTGGFFDLGSPITWGATTTATGNPQQAINLAGISALQNLSEMVTFRVVNWDTTNSGGNWYFNSTSPGSNDLLVQGTVTAVPEPSTLALLALAGLATLRRRPR
jgi:hypothetical protein